mgnify:FL=1
MTIDIYDNVLESDLSTLIDTEMKKVRWKYDYNSHKGEVNKHWHIHCGDANIKPQYSFIQHIWDVGKERYNFEEKYKVNKFKRVYCNSHTHGIEPHLHHDDGDFTMIYYPRLDWKTDWGGGTRVGEDLVPYVGNRLIVFNARTPHQAMPVSRQCYELRSVIVFKTYIGAANDERLDFYKN